MASRRMTGKEPNVQNIPLRTETGRRVREASHKEGVQLIEVDYAELEVRAAAMSGPIVKVTGEAELECGKPCEHANLKTHECHHPEFDDKRFKPFLIAEQGMTHPVFCPLVKDKND
jgi:hypothetical protein